MKDYKSVVTKIDQDTGERVVIGSTGEGTDVVDGMRIIGLEKAGAIICDNEGRRARVTSDGHLACVAASGLPILMTSASTIADAYQSLGVAQRECHFCNIYVQTNPIIVSFDNGVTDHAPGIAGSVIQMEGLKIPAGAVLKVKNATAGQNYANVRVWIW